MKLVKLDKLRISKKKFGGDFQGYFEAKTHSGKSVHLKEIYRLFKSPTYSTRSTFRGMSCLKNALFEKGKMKLAFINTKCMF